MAKVKITCEECGGRGGFGNNSETVERCDVCQGSGIWEVERDSEEAKRYFKEMYG